MRACFVLNKEMKIKTMAVNVALRLFDACILPFLTYAAEVWQHLRGLILTHREANKWQHMNITYFRILLMVLKGLPNKKMVIICRESLQTKSVLSHQPISVQLHKLLLNYT